MACAISRAANVKAKTYARNVLGIGFVTQNTRDQQPRTKETANMSDTNERSVASTGSVADVSQFANREQPVAFGIECDGELLAAYTCEDEESAKAMIERFAASGMTGHVVVPLYRAPQAAWQLVHDNERLRDDVMLLKDAIRRLAEQDATLSVCNGNVTVTMDATLTDAEREAVEYYIGTGGPDAVDATLRGLLERLG